jgi:hypothetical protein
MLSSGTSVRLSSESTFSALNSREKWLIPFHITLLAMKSCIDGKNQIHTSEMTRTKITVIDKRLDTLIL